MAQKPTIVLAPGSAGPAPARTLAGAGTLLAIGRGQPGILPEDFRIGPLGNGQSGSSDRDAAWQAASRFLARLVAGTVDRASIAPDSRDSLSDTLTYGLQQGYAPTSFRLGAPKEESDGEIAANVRLFGATGTSEGEIYLARSANTWLVADVQVNLADLAVPPAAPKGPFLPSPYRWLLEE